MKNIGEAYKNEFRFKHFLTPDEVANILIITYETVLNLIHQGDLNAIIVDNSYRISEHDLND